MWLRDLASFLFSQGQGQEVQEFQGVLDHLDSAFYSFLQEFQEIQVKTEGSPGYLDPPSDSWSGGPPSWGPGRSDQESSL